MVELIVASQVHLPTLENLMQLYAYDWSEMAALDVGDDGRFAAYPLEPFVRDEGRHAFLFRDRDEGKLVGFALVSAQSRLTGESGVYDMSEFFVMRRYRRGGVGTAAAHALFERFPARWEVRERDSNTAATAFWRRAIGTFTRGDFRDVRWNDEKWTGPVQSFSSAAR